jgi:hypothetical protein
MQNFMEKVKSVLFEDAVAEREVTSDIAPADDVPVASVSTNSETSLTEKVMSTIRWILGGGESA